MQAQHLGQHERCPPIIIEFGENCIEFDAAGLIGNRQRAAMHPSSRIGHHSRVTTTAATGATDMVGTDPAGDREQPAPRMTIGAISVERGDGPFVGLLSEVVCVLSVAEVSADPPHVVLGFGYEPFEASCVAIARRHEQVRQVIHDRPILAPQGTKPKSATTEKSVNCDHTREILSAAADGEEHLDERRAMHEHVDSCSACARFANRVNDLDRVVRIRPAERVPDLVQTITSRTRPAQLGRGGWLRPALAWLALVIAAQNMPALILGHTGGMDAHMSRHLGAFGVALAIGFAFAAWKPHRAFGLLPLVAALVVTMVASTAFDVLDGGRSALAESAHTTELVGLALLWMIAGSPGWHGFQRRFRWSPRSPITH